MVCAAAAALGTAVWAWCARHDVRPVGRAAWRPAFWLALPATALSCACVVMQGILFTVLHGHPLYQYSPEGPWGVWATSWPAWLLALPLAGLLALASFAVVVRGRPGPLLAMRLCALLSCAVSWVGVWANFPSR
jgi:hypothetical protein